MDKEIAKFNRLAQSWWDEDGEMRLLHRLNPLRLSWMRSEAEAHFGLKEQAKAPLQGLRVLDIGCGGGLLAEPLARLGARLTGLDESEEMIAIARTHAAEQKLAIDYRCMSLAKLARAESSAFDMVCLMEVIEHVEKPADFVRDAARCLAPGGLLFAATLNRSLAAFGLAIVGAEYVLQWVPRGTHDWRKFLTPEEFASLLKDADLRVRAMRGARYNPLTAAWQLSYAMRVNYMLSAVKPKAARGAAAPAAPPAPQ